MIPRFKFEDDVSLVCVDTREKPPKFFPFHSMQGIIRFKEELKRDFVGHDFKDSVLGGYNAIGVKYYCIDYESETGVFGISHRMLLWQAGNAYIEYFDTEECTE